MNLLAIAWTSLRRHRASSALAALALASGVALLLAVAALRQQAHERFTQAGLGVDAVLGPKGSPLQIVLNAVYHLDDMPGRVPWTTFQAVKTHPAVADGFALVTGHSYGGVRVNAVETRFLSEFHWKPATPFALAAGRLPTGVREAVAGAEAAARLGIAPGFRFCPVCGVNPGDPVHDRDEITVTGVLAATGTPHDRVIYLRLEDFYTLGGHGSDTAAMADDPAHRDISGAYLVLTRIRGGGFHPGIQDLQYQLRQSPKAQLVLPAETMPRLFSVIGWVDRVLEAVAALVAVLGAAFLTLALLATLRERRRDLALLRALGAGRRTVGGLVLLQALVISIAGTLLGLVLAHGLLWYGCAVLTQETGLVFTPWCWSTTHTLVLALAPLLGLGAGLVPAIQAYRLPLLSTLSPHTS
jgi:putative ABC transport system permease protein